LERCAGHRSGGSPTRISGDRGRVATVPSGPLDDHLPEHPIGPPAVKAQEAVIQTAATAVVTATAIARIVVAPQRLNERAGNGSADRQPRLMPGTANLDRSDRSSRRIKHIDPVDEVPESRNNIMSAE
jgi:hypothetical protein